MKKVAFIASVAALLLPIGASADGHEEEAPAPLSDVWWVVPKKGMETEFSTVEPNCGTIINTIKAEINRLSLCHINGKMFAIPTHTAR